MDLDKLERLVKLKESGALTEEEFQKEKEKLMNENASSNTTPNSQPSYQYGQTNYNANTSYGPVMNNQRSYQYGPANNINTTAPKKTNGCLIAFIVVICILVAPVILSLMVGGATIKKAGQIRQNYEKEHSGEYTTSTSNSSSSTSSSASTSSDTSSSITSTIDKAISNAWSSRFEISETTTSSDGYSTYIEGTITNKTNHKMSYVQVVFNLYDKDGAQIGTAMDNINNLEANGKWKFKAMSFDFSGKATSYKLSEITGF